jgi:carbohydrate-selective porin OprB
MAGIGANRMPFVTYKHVALAALLNCFLVPMNAQESGANSYLLGDWGGERTRLQNAGVVLNIFYVNDLLTDTRGDLANWSRVRGTLDIDFGKAELVRGLKFHIAAMWQAGGVLGTYIGAIANPSSNAAFDLTRLVVVRAGAGPR